MQRIFAITDLFASKTFTAFLIYFYFFNRQSCTKHHVKNQNKSKKTVNFNEVERSVIVFLGLFSPIGGLRQLLFEFFPDEPYLKSSN